MLKRRNKSIKSLSINYCMGKEKKIMVDNGVRAKLLEFGSYPTIRKALNGKANTPQTLKIRHEALNLGGIEVKIEEETNLPESNDVESCSYQ